MAQDVLAVLRCVLRQGELPAAEHLLNAIEELGSSVGGGASNVIREAYFEIARSAEKGR